MLKAEWAPYRLMFNFEARTSRQVMTYKDTYFVRVFDSDDPGHCGYGECALFRGLSAEDCPDYESALAEACRNPLTAQEHPYSSIRFGFETAISSLTRDTGKSNPWLAGCTGIPINGLVWMGDKATMRSRIQEKLDAGFRIIKLKIGGINFEDELDLLREVRRNFSADSLEIRLDANGAFTPANALARLDSLSKFDIHSIEQPIKAGQREEMTRICRESPIPVALDEELIGVRDYSESVDLLNDIRPSYIILKPALCGGFSSSMTYIIAARSMNIGWWLTSALESNVGLAAIGRWLTDYHKINRPQGLGTGQLYTNNIGSPLQMRGPELFHNPSAAWESLDHLQWRS